MLKRTEVCEDAAVESSVEKTKRWGQHQERFGPFRFGVDPQTIGFARRHCDGAKPISLVQTNPLIAAGGQL
jgi:hypothetical protein